MPLYNLMEDAATAEISRAQIWQCLRHGARLEDGRTIDRALVDRLLAEEVAALKDALGEDRFEERAFRRRGRPLHPSRDRRRWLPQLPDAAGVHVLNTIHDGENAD